MNFTEHLSTVADCNNEADLSHEWLISLLDSVDRKKTLQRRWEKKNQKGRRDLVLSFQDREVCVIELKSPSVSNLNEHLLQIHRYVYAQNFWRNGNLNPCLGILTNGHTAILIDGRQEFSSASRSAVELRIDTKNGFSELMEVLVKIKDGKRGHLIHSAIEYDTRSSAKDIIETLSAELLGYYSRFKKISGKRRSEPLHLTLQLFLVAVLRDCGFIPTALMQECYQTKKWSRLTKELNKILSSNFEPIPDQEKIVEIIYQETRTLCARLDVIPPDCLGRVYESLLHKISKDNAVTSYYTPFDLAFSVVKKLGISKSSRVLDPSCGSGTFLTTTLEYLFSSNRKTGNDLTDEIFNFISKNLIGVDRDDNACTVAKAMLLATGSQLCGLDPAQRDIKLPNLNLSIVNKDFFLVNARDFKNVTHVVGNAPWGGVDSNRNKDNILDPIVRERANISKYKSYFRNVDVSALFLEKVVKVFPNKKVGLLIKQQSLHNDGSSNFLPWANKEGISFHDYGDKEFFGNPSSLTAIAFIGTSERPGVKDKSTKLKSLSKNMIKIGKFFHIFEAFEANRAHIYIDVANRLIEKGFGDLPFIVPMYPTYDDSRHLKLPRNLQKICFIPNGVPPPLEFLNELTKDEKKILSSRVQVSSKFKYNYRGTEGRKFYKFDSPDGIRVTMPINYNPVRALAMIDERGKGIPIKDHSCVLIPKADPFKDLTYCLLGWLNSKYFYFECLRSNVKRLSGGRLKFQGKQKLGICIPKELLNKDFSIFVKKLLKKDVITQTSLGELDAMIVKLCKNPNYWDEISTKLEQEKALKTINLALKEFDISARGDKFYKPDKGAFL